MKFQRSIAMYWTIKNFKKIKLKGTNKNKGILLKWNSLNINSNIIKFIRIGSNDKNLKIWRNLN